MMARSAKKRRRELMVASAQAFGETRRINRTETRRFAKQHEVMLRFMVIYERFMHLRGIWYILGALHSTQVLLHTPLGVSGVIEMIASTIILSSVKTTLRVSVLSASNKCEKGTQRRRGRGGRRACVVACMVVSMITLPLVVA